ncbi:hypothetical protein EsH8_XV_000019 [Colletotrichum jinshuiense]
MCRANTAESVEGMPVSQLRRGRNKKLEWCPRAHTAMFRHLARHKPDRKACSQAHLEDLLVELNCVHSDSEYSALVYPRVQRALEAKFAKLAKEQTIVEHPDGTCVWPPWTISWVHPAWDGDTKPPLLPAVGEEQASSLDQTAPRVGLSHLSVSTASIDPTYQPPSPSTVPTAPTDRFQGGLVSSGVLTTVFDPHYVSATSSPTVAESSGLSTTTFDPSFAPSYSSSRRQPRSRSSGMSATTFDPRHIPSRATDSYPSSPQADESSRLSTTSFDPSYAPSSAQDERAQTTTPATAWRNSVNVLPSPPASPHRSCHRRGGGENFPPVPQVEDFDPIFPSDSSSNIGTRYGRQYDGRAPGEASSHPLLVIQEQEHEHGGLVHQYRRPEIQHVPDLSLAPLPTVPLRIKHHVKSWLSQRQGPQPMTLPRDLPGLLYPAVAPLRLRTPLRSKTILAAASAAAAAAAETPNQVSDLRASLATSSPILVRAINDAKRIKLNAADQWRLRTLSLTDAAISAVTSLLHRINGTGVDDARLDATNVRAYKGALALCRSVLWAKERRSGNKDYDDAHIALQQVLWLRRDIAGLATRADAAGVADSWRARESCDDEAATLNDLVFGIWAR